MREAGSRRRRAFTLIELLIVVVILGIASALIVPNLAGMSDFGATAAARIVAADLQYAQNYAITYQDPVTITFNTGNETYQLTNARGPLIHPINKTAYTVALASQKGFEGLNIVSTGFTGGKVTFDELGSPDNAGRVTLQDGTTTYYVDVAAATGKVAVTRGP